jgi:hypothetical protein
MIHTRHLTRRWLAATLAVCASALSLTACGGRGGDTPAPPAAAEPAPAALQATWVAPVLTQQGQLFPYELTIGPTTYRVDGVDTTTAYIESAGADKLRFSGASACPGSGVYTWTLKGNELTLDLTSPDPCTRRTEILTGKPWVRRP